MTENNKDNLFQMGSAEMGKAPIEVLSSPKPSSDEGKTNIPIPKTVKKDK